MKPLQPAISLPPHYPTWVKAVRGSTGLSEAQARNLYNDEFLSGDTFMNDIYVVIRTELKSGITHLSIRRRDRRACRDWRHFQEMKNQLCSEVREAIEIYPAESRLVDTANQFHLWVFPEGVIVPAGYFFGRHVHDDLKVPGAVQRPLDIRHHTRFQNEVTWVFHQGCDCNQCREEYRRVEHEQYMQQNSNLFNQRNRPK